jgi:hypothetical protein
MVYAALVISCYLGGYPKPIEVTLEHARRLGLGLTHEGGFGCNCSPPLGTGVWFRFLATLRLVGSYAKALATADKQRVSPMKAHWALYCALYEYS